LDWHTPSPPPSLIFGDSAQQANDSTITVEQFQQIRNLIRDQGIRIAAMENAVNRSQIANVAPVPLPPLGTVSRSRRGRNQGRQPRVRAHGQQALQPNYDHPIRSVDATVSIISCYVKYPFLKN
jgi:Cu2+-containing amine oxidase